MMKKKKKSKILNIRQLSNQGNTWGLNETVNVALRPAQLKAPCRYTGTPA